MSDFTYQCWAYLRDKELELNNAVLAAANAVIRQSHKLDEPGPEVIEPRFRTAYGRGEASKIVLGVLNGHPLKSSEVMQLTGIAHTSQILHRLRSLGQVVKENGGWLKAKG